MIHNIFSFHPIKADRTALIVTPTMKYTIKHNTNKTGMYFKPSFSSPELINPRTSELKIAETINNAIANPLTNETLITTGLTAKGTFDETSVEIASILARLFSLSMLRQYLSRIIMGR